MEYLMFEKIEPNDGILKSVHRELLGCVCYIVASGAGEGSAIIKYLLNNESSFCRLNTSSVIDEYEEGDRKIIITENTKYVLRRIEIGDFI